MVLTGCLLYSYREVDNCRGEAIQEWYRTQWCPDEGKFYINKVYRRVDGELSLETTHNFFYKDMQINGFTEECPLKPKQEYISLEAYRRLFEGECLRTYDPERCRTLKIYVNGEGQLRYETEDGTEGGDYIVTVSTFNKQRFYEI